MVEYDVNKEKLEYYFIYFIHLRHFHIILYIFEVWKAFQSHAQDATKKLKHVPVPKF